MNHEAKIRYPAPGIRVLRDGLIVTLGLAVILGNFFNSDITIWNAARTMTDLCQ